MAIAELVFLQHTESVSNAYPKECVCPRRFKKISALNRSHKLPGSAL